MNVLSWFGRRNADRPVDITSAAFKADPYPYYARLRNEAPVHPVPMRDGRTAWLVTRYDDVVTVLKDERFAKDRYRLFEQGVLQRLPWMPKVFLPLMTNMLNSDPPDHTRLRALVAKAFTPSRVQSMRGGIERLTGELLDRQHGRPRFDLVRDYALPLPTTIIAEMLGVPLEYRHAFHKASNALLSSVSPWTMLKAIPSVLSIMRTIRKLGRERREQPRDDMLTALVQASESGSQLSDDELVGMVMLMLIAGHETTVNLIGNGVLALLDHPEQLERLRKDPSLVESAVEELVRYASPVETATERFTTEDVTLSGITIPKGSFVLAVIASANRDETRFRDPDTLDIAREPNKHLSFGLGIHYCLGAPLARMEGQIALTTLLERVGEIRLGVPRNSLQWRSAIIVRGLKALPLAAGQWQPAAPVPAGERDLVAA